MPTVLRSRHKWRRLEERSQQGQKEFLDGLQDRFRIETVSSVNRNVKKGDHLVFEGAKYDHHLLCSGVTKEENDDVVEIIEYTGSTGSRNCSSGSARVAFSLDFTGVGGIKKKKYTYEELEAKNAIKVIWPDELQRFDVDERVRRAERREGEANYDCLKNNCEHFVTWCICGLNASLQVKSWYMKLRDTVYSGVAGFARSAVDYVSTANVGPLLVKAVANVRVAPCAGFLIGGILEVGLAGYQIKQAHKQYQKGIVIPTKKRFVAKITEICTKSACRFGGCVAGSVIGSAFGPVGTLVGGAIGACIGHLIGCVVGPKLGKSFGWLFSDGLNELEAFTFF